MVVSLKLVVLSFLSFFKEGTINRIQLFLYIHRVNGIHMVRTKNRFLLIGCSKESHEWHL